MPIQITGFLKQRLALIGVLLLVAVSRLPYLGMAFYWDESWPYATTIRRIYEHGLSLLPSAIDGEYSRGHPLFFHNAAAAWMLVFGTGHVAMHSFALFVSLLFLVVVYEAGLRLYNQQVATVAILLLATQLMYLVQVTFLLPDMMGAFLAFLAVYIYATSRHYWLKALILSALFLNKESGLYVGFVIGLDALVRLIRDKEHRRDRMGNFLAVSAAVVVMGLFFIAQKYTRGWFILPLYNELIERSWSMFFWHFRDAWLMMAKMESRQYVFLLLLVLPVLAYLKTRLWKYLALLVPVAVIALVMSDKHWDTLPSSILFPLVIASVYFPVYQYQESVAGGQVGSRRYLFLVTSCFLAYLILSCCNLLLKRYLLTSLGFLMLMGAIYFQWLCAAIHRHALWLVVIVIVGAGYYSYRSCTTTDDTSPNAFKALEVQQQLVVYMEQHVPYTKNVGTGGYLTQVHLNDPYTGFLKGSNYYKHTRWEIDGNTDIAIFNNIEHDDDRHQQVAKDTAYRLLVRLTSGTVWAEIYERKQ